MDVRDFLCSLVTFGFQYDARKTKIIGHVTAKQEKQQVQHVNATSPAHERDAHPENH